MAVETVEESGEEWKQLPVKKATKRSADAKNGMEVEEINGIEGVSKAHTSAPKKAKVAPSFEFRKVPVPRNRFTPLKENWMKIFTPIVEHLKLQVRFNLKTRNVEIRSCAETEDVSNVQKAADFVRAFVYGFEVEDALALLRLENLFVETFDIKDVKTLKGDHLSRAIGRLSGKGGRTRFTIENVTKTRIVIADSRIHILGSFQNIQVAMKALCNLILGSPPSKVYGQLRNVANRLGDRL
uniref:K Homology domain-containing protein n=1 Tax=Riptortus pedestris TaxID=329032 RepID=R4WD85_RIPPE|nr:conserved hypothetical protein [Riptortus pedestris]